MSRAVFSSNFPADCISSISTIWLLVKYPFDLHYKIVADSKFVIKCFLGKKRFFYKELIVNKYLAGGFSDESSILRTVERWKLVSELKLKDQKSINDYYFRRLKNEKFYSKYFINISNQKNSFLTKLLQRIKKWGI